MLNFSGGKNRDPPGTPERKFHLRILSVGEVLWDVFETKEILGGAPLNFSASAKRLGNAVALLTAVGADTRGSLAMTTMRELGVSSDLVQTVSQAGTGTAIVTTDSAGNATFSIQRPAAFDFVDLNDATLTRIRQFHPDWIYYGTLAQTAELQTAGLQTAGLQTAELQTGGRAEQRLLHLLSANPEARCFYDINLREGHWNLELVERLSRLASIVKMNEAEAEKLFELTQSGKTFSMPAFCEFWVSTYGGKTLCITLGGEGCAVWQEGVFQTFSGFPVTVADTVGAGDAFAAAFLHGHQNGWSIERTATFANAMGALVASRPGATPAWTIQECTQLIEQSPGSRSNRGQQEAGS